MAAKNHALEAIIEGQIDNDHPDEQMNELIPQVTRRVLSACLANIRSLPMAIPCRSTV
ncbi:hypothetical protein N9248_01190 [bacterium]|nr:hypothetical protein [bacterium]